MENLRHASNGKDSMRNTLLQQCLLFTNRLQRKTYYLGMPKLLSLKTPQSTYV